MEKFLLKIIFLALTTLLLNGCVFQNEQEKANNQLKKQLQQEDWSTDDLPTVKNPGPGVTPPPGF